VQRMAAEDLAAAEQRMAVAGVINPKFTVCS